MEQCASLDCLGKFEDCAAVLICCGGKRKTESSFEVGTQVLALHECPKNILEVFMYWN